MLKALQIKNYALIDSLDIQFPAGLIIITGQTGAGKSIILGALSLVLGAKADASMVGENADNCVVEAEFEINADSTLKEIVENNSLDWNNGSLIVRRVLSKSGRSRSFVNDEPVNIGVLTELSDRLLDIHSQHATLLLKDKKFQLSMLDYYAGNAALLEKCKSSYQLLASLEMQYRELSGRLEAIIKEKDYNQARYEKLDAAHLQTGELEELESEQKRLANAGSIKESLCQVEGLLSSVNDDSTSLDASLKEAVKILSKLGSLVPEAEHLSERLESARIEIDDIFEGVSQIEGSLDVSGGELDKLEQRMGLIYDLLKNYSCTTVDELISIKESLSENLLDSGRLEEQKDELSKHIASEKSKLKGLCALLHESRAGAIGPFSESIQASIRGLELERAAFLATLSETELSPTGKDDISFMFSASGVNMTEVSKCASGGEMSRIMLCLKAMLAKYTNMPSMVFDEIDTGVSGSVADKMGSMICDMGKDMQVFAITHLPQVAAKGDAHYIVSKEISPDGVQRTDIRKIDGEARVMEIARMLSGSSITPEAIANAKSFIEN